jgi:predicted MFS family arabinose efflux permease
VSAQRQATGIGRGLVLLLATATGAAAANMYYAQPLLHTLADAFDVSIATAGLLVTISQVGYVFGLAFLVPLGDLLERRRLIVIAMLCVAAAQTVEALSPGFEVFAAAMLVVGVSTFVAQVIVPMSSLLAAEDERGKVVGTVMSGLLLGILLARTVSGLIATAFGWRAVFGFAAGVMLVLAVVLAKVLPEVEPTSDLEYGPALRSVLQIVREEPVLRQRMLLGACGMGCFSVLWTALAFLLSGEHGSSFHYSNATIGLFGLAGVVGASAAQIAGRLADRGYGRLATTGSLAAMLVSWALLALGASSVIVLIVGIMALDLGVQGLQISNQSAIYELRPEARSRLTTGYMVAYFTGGVILSAITSELYAADGWNAVCVLGAVTAVIGLVAWALTANRVAHAPVVQPGGERRSLRPAWRRASS